jgi:hypothetical protein
MSRYRKPLVNILSDLNSSLTYPVTILKATQNGTTWTLNVDDAYHAQKGFTITIGGKPYIIVSVSAQTWGDILTVTGTDTITATSFSMYSAYFFFGTLVDGGIQLGQIADASQKTPLIFLRVDDTLRETYNDDPEDSHERTSSCKLYYLSQGDDTLLNPDALAFYVEPMKRLAENFNQAMKDKISIFEIWDENYDLTNYAKFGVYSGGKQPSKIWTDDLAGCGMDRKFKILRTQNE